MSDTRKKLFGLFRSQSRAEKQPRKPLQDLDQTYPRPERSRTSRSPQGHPPRSNSPLQDSRRSSTRHHSLLTLAPLTSWPPSGLLEDEALSERKARELIITGAPIFTGHRRAVPHTENEYFAFYTSADGRSWTGDDRSEPFTAAFAASSMCLQGPGPSAHPWDSLEQPSMSFCYGTRPGTCTLNHWVGLSGRPNAYIELRDPNIEPREVKLETILERLVDLEDEFEEDREDVLYKILYRTLLEDPDRRRKPHKPMEKQITDLIVVLSRKEWIDFSRPENQVVAKFFVNAAYADKGRYKLFFHQLLLSMELDLRISWKKHQDWAKRELLSKLPSRIAWDLALARKWRECMSIKKFAAGGDPEQIKFRLRVKKAQVKALRRFARAMKWPNLAKVDNVMKERAADAKPLEDRSSDSMSYFTGIILPGPTLPFLAMNSLVDCDDDPSASALTALSHMQPNCGFQYKSTTYWSSTCILGKVLAPTCNEICGWIGPARPAPDLSRAQIARIRQRKPKQGLKGSDVDSMTVRSDPLGPPSDTYPVAEYKLPVPSSNPAIDTIRIEKISLKPYPPESSSGVYDAAIQFAIDGRSWPLRLLYDVSFISAFPCVGGPHPLFFDYVYSTTSVDEILSIHSWGSAGSVAGGSTSMDARAASASTSSKEEDDLKEKVLVVEAFGVKDNEVLARAWCAQWGLSAVVAEVGKTCLACAIREAYAGCVNVLILVDWVGEGEGEESA